MDKTKSFLLALISSMIVTNLSIAAEAPSEDSIQEIIVTAQKRSERAMDVPMSITAASGDELREMGVSSVSDLSKVVPGFTYQPSDYGTPVYTLRGVGLKDVAVAVAPTVSVYTDQVPIPFSAMTDGATLDLERVEVLKGPQGTLFGQNSTGGAINYIAAKPTRHFEAGMDVSGGRFNDLDVAGFISGPLSETLSARIAVHTEQRDGWQQSETRNDSLGTRNFSNGRLLLDWVTAAGVSVEVNVNGWLNKSDTQAAQFVQYSPANPAGRPTLIPYLTAYTPAPNESRLADWDPGKHYRRDDSFVQASVRADWSGTDWVTLTSITAYSSYRQNSPIDTDGTNVNDFTMLVRAAIHSLSQELRLSGTLPDKATQWMLGANFETDTTHDNQNGQFMGTSAAVGPVPYNQFINSDNQEVHRYAAFAKLDYALSHVTTVEAGARVTKAFDNFNGCVRDAGDGAVAAAFSLLASRPIPPGHCVTLDPTTFAAVPIVSKALDESNASWRVGLNVKPNEESLYYANVTKGFKAGSFPTVPGLLPVQFSPVPQESVLAYEIGFKDMLFDRTLQLSGAAFFYDYSDKQLIGYVTTAFGNLPALISIPRSSVLGAELYLIWKPTHGVTATLGSTYVDSRVTSSFVANDPFGGSVNLRDEAFPNTPRWQHSLDLEYNFHVSDRVTAYLGGTESYRTRSSAAFGDSPEFNVPSYGLLDVRLGIKDGPWHAELYGHNVANRFYLESVTHVVDTVARLTGMPVTYGITVGRRF